MTVGRPRTMSDEQILAGAARVIARVGPARLTLAEVGREVGLAAATLTQRFKTKRGLLLALARHGADALPGRLAAARSADAPAGALIDSFVALAGGVRTSAEFANHLAFLLLDLTDPQFQQISRDYADAVEQAIAEVLAAAHTAGELAHDDLTDLPRAIHAAYNGAMVTWGMHGRGSPADQVRTQLTILLEPYLGSEDSPRNSTR
ncbi:TetR family transcriptional regulator [Actinomycetes bacterium KLBMP 9797]